MGAKINLLVLQILFYSACSFGQNITVLNDTASQYPVGKLSYILRDPAGNLTINDVSSGAASKEFKESNSAEVNFGHTNDAIWIRFSVKSEAYNNLHWLINEDYSMIDKVEFYIPSSVRQYTKLTAGMAVPLSGWAFKNRRIVFPFNLTEGEQKTFYLRFESQYSLPVHLQIWKPESFAYKEANNNLFFGIFYGALLIMALYNLFLFFSVKDSSYLYYFLYAVCLSYYQATMDGISFMLFASNNIWINLHIGLIALGLAALFWTLFAKEFLEISKFSRIFNRVYIILTGICISYIIFLISLPVQITTVSSAPVWMGSIVVNIISGIYCWRKGNNNARIYLLATFIFIIGAMFRTLRIVGIIPESILTEGGMLLGILAEMTILSFALGNRINTIKRTEEREKELIRSRIASDLHDEIGSNLSSISLSSQMLKKSPRLEAGEIEQIDDITETAKETAQSIRDIIWFIHPEHDKPDDLVLKMRDIAAKLFSDTSCTFDACDSKIMQTKDLRFRRNLYLIYKEILHNVAKHSKASHIQIKLNENLEELRLEVIDDGIGFDESRIDNRHGEGINNLKKRTDEIGGSLHINSKPGKGTSVLLKVRI